MQEIPLWPADKKMGLYTRPISELYIKFTTFNHDGSLQWIVLTGSGARTRTRDGVVNSHLLYQLSYTGRK